MLDTAGDLWEKDPTQQPILRRDDVEIARKIM